MLWRKPENLKYTDLCIYVDAHAREIMNPGENPQTEDLIYNYIWLLVKALAIKKRMFENFSDYDGYAMYSANRLFMAIRRSYQNEGKVIKGKTIAPIKSILNYTKALMYPMKLEYLHEQYNITSTADLIDKQSDEFAHKQQLREEAWEQQGGKVEFKSDTIMRCKSFSRIVDNVLKKLPFPPGSVDYKKLKISILMNCLQNLKNGKGFSADPVPVIVWKLPKTMRNYVRVFIKELGTEIKREIISTYSYTIVDDKIIDYMISNPDGEFVSREE